GTTGPVAAHWNVDGHRDWQIQQVKAGKHFLPSIRLHMYAVPGTDGLDAIDLPWLAANQIPLTLRCNNVTQFADDALRPEVRDLPFDTSPLVWRKLADGSLDIRPIVDSLGPAGFWRDEGTRWGQSLFVQALRQRYSPPWTLFVENNEGPFENPKTFAGPNGAWTLPIDGNSLRLAQLHPPNLAAYTPGYWARRASLYKTMFDAFGGLTLTGCYGLNAGEVDTYDGGSFRVYVGGGSFTDLSTYDAVT